MPCSSEVVLQWHDFNAGDVGLPLNFNFCDAIIPVNIEDGAETRPVKALEETNVTAVDDVSFKVVRKSGKNHDPVDPYLSLVPKAFVVPNAFVQFVK